MTTVSIHSASSLPEHHHAAYALFCTHRFDPWKFHTFEKAMLKPYSVIALVNNELAGYVLVSEVVGEVEIEDVCVLPAFRSAGIASNMFSHIIAYSKTKSADYIFLEVASRNTNARALYEKMGFDVLSVRKRYYTLANKQFDDAVLMRRNIKNIDL